ncbi:serine/threonine-protein kinase [Rugosimonospora acidiphila]|uniref:serine/threonine-protein kinase n=1 Tax=Rugosimonospora acidiphila TaxID=556531 RepID=UPI0031EDF4B9
MAIGNGGMGTVWHAADTILRRDVAVKEVLLPPGMAASDRDAMYERTLREARAAAALSHPSVVQVYDVVTEGGRPWIVMELLHARSLADMIISDGPLAPRAVAKIGIALLGALEVAHGAGVLHRDVKPANVLICTDGRCVLTDFGVARMPAESNLTTPGMVLGSPHFISPERAVGGAFGPPSDLFSLGVSLFTAVEGRPPFDKGDPFETMRAVVEEPPAAPVRAGLLAPVLYGLLEKDPARRWDVRAARQALRDLLAGPLASNASQHVTDPYTVVPVAQPPRPVYQSDRAAQQGQIGGRAMLAPGELPTDRISGRPVPPPPHNLAGGPAMLEHTSPGFPPPPTFPNQPQPTFPNQPQPTFPNQPQRGTVHGKPRGGGMLADISAGAKPLLNRFRGLPKAAQAGIVGGVAVVLVIAIIGLAGGFGGGSSTPAARASAAASPSGPGLPVVKYSDPRGFSLNVPADWKQTGSSYFDFTDPKDPLRRLRVNVETAGNSNADYMKAVGRALDNPKVCTAPYKQVALNDDVTLSGHPAAELEYTCGTGPDARHGIWRATVIDKKAYEFYLSVEDSRFAASKPIYDEAVESYKLNLGN